MNILSLRNRENRLKYLHKESTIPLRKIPSNPLSNFEWMDDYFMIMKTLYNNLDRKSQSRKPESSGLASLRKMAAYIQEHYMEHITLADIAYEYGFNGASRYCETFKLPLP